MGCHAPLLGIFPTQGSNPGLPHCRQILYCLSHQGSQWILEWVACPFSKGSSRPRDWTGISCITGGFFTTWATRESQMEMIISISRRYCNTGMGNHSLLQGIFPTQGWNPGLSSFRWILYCLSCQEAQILSLCFKNNFLCYEICILGTHLKSVLPYMLEARHPDQTKGVVASTFFYESRCKNVFRFNLWNPQRSDVKTWIQTKYFK